MDTIFALASARGKAGVAVIRISGSQAHAAVQEIAGNVPPARQASLRLLRAADESVLDQALVLVFEAGESFTGEASAEFQLHGSPAVLSAVLDRLSGIAGCRLAEPGEFTRRALENERLDMAQVEGLGALIEAETEAQRVQALRVFSGALGRKVEAWRAALISAAALLEVTIDFADEEVPVDVTPDVRDLVLGVTEELRAEVEGSAIAERIRDGFEVAIVGPPNIGKSTLLNSLAGRDAALTSEVAGTTRDVIEVRMDLRGLPVTLLDTAGLRETEDQVETLGIARAKDRAAAADLRVFLLEERTSVREVSERPGDVVALGKADQREGDDFAVSGETGEGIDELVDRIASVLQERACGALTATHKRHREAMSRTLSHLEHVLGGLDTGVSETELIAEDLRNAIRALESLVGRIDVDHILDDIFARFCLGK